ncbi:MAG: hypothetical protein ACPL07_01010 [Candidatus Bathyarchaeia archaeon]
MDDLKPELELYPWIKIAPTLAVIFISPALLTVGGTIGTLLPIEMAAVVSIVAGLVFSSIIYLHGGVGSREHMGLLKLMEASLGDAGSRFFASPHHDHSNWLVLCPYNFGRRGPLKTHTNTQVPVHNSFWNTRGQRDVLQLQ